jgi:hypothetical protein
MPYLPVALLLLTSAFAVLARLQARAPSPESRVPVLGFRLPPAGRSPSAGAGPTPYSPLPLRFALAAALFFAALGTSCGGGGNTVIQNPGTPSGTYTLTVTARITSGSTAVTHTLTLTLKVN